MDQTQSFSLPLHSPSLHPPSQYQTHHLQPQQQQQQQPQSHGPVSYSPTFADSLTNAVLSSPSPNISNQSPSPISPSPLQIPLPLESPMRQHPSHLHPNVSLTHPNGTLYGGPTPFPAHSLRAHAQDIVELNNLNSKQELQAYLLNEIVKRGHEMEHRLKERKRLKEGNERVKRNIRILEEDREVEIRMEDRWRSEKERKGR